jgi:hypothetical protein
MTLLRVKHDISSDSALCDSLLFLIERCTSLEELGAVWAKWGAEIRENARVGELVKEKDKRKEVLSV